MKSQLGKIFHKLNRQKGVFFGSFDYKKFVIIARSRTGSNLLNSLLGSHKEIETNGEIFSYLKDYSCGEVWKKTFVKKEKKINWVGFKLFYYHPIDSIDKSVWDYIDKDPEIHVIHLRRENMLRTYISRLIAGKLKIWLNKDSEDIKIEEKKIKVNIEECFEEFKKIKIWEDETRSRFINRKNYIELTYEELIESRDVMMSKIFSFLNLESIPTKTKLEKQNPESIDTLVTNYPELKKAILNSDFSYLLDNEV